MHELMVGVPKHRLPQTFQDAIAVAKVMDINYIWIDSLCILQDEEDLSDWLTESLLMEDVYANGYCNIAATASSNSSQGLFRHRDAGHFRHVEMRCSLGSALNQGHLASHYTEFTPEPWKAGLHKAPLNSRGWVLQERLLARRVIHFAQNELIWECHHLLASETFPRGYPLVGTESRSFKEIWSQPGKSETAGNEEESCNASKLSRYDTWDRVASTYRRCQLTRPSDKLIALSGIARRFQTTLEDRYVAGMWESRLTSSILWHVGENCLRVPDGKHNYVYSQSAMGPLPGENGYRAPTWSWASIDQDTSLFGNGTELLIKVDDIRLQSQVEDTVAQLSHASLRLHGEVKPISFRRNNRVEEYLWQPRLFPGTEVTDNSLIRWPSVYLDRLIDLESEHCVNKTFFVPVRRIDISDSTVDPHHRLLALYCLLIVLADPDTASYARIGVMTCVGVQVLDYLQASREQRTKVFCEAHDPKSKMPYAIRLL